MLINEHPLLGKENKTPEEQKLFRAWQTQFRGERINLFHDEIVRPILPNASFTSSFSFGNPDMVHTAARLEYISSNKDLVGSDYFLDMEKSSRLIHFTSKQALLEILRSASLRMYSLSHMDDPNEFIQTLDNVGFDKNSEIIKRMRHHLFSTSFVHYPNGVNDENFEDWRTYGLDGNGVAIVFRIENEDRTLWSDFHLSQVYYDGRETNTFGNLKQRIDSFREKHCFVVVDAEKTFAPLFAFHKDSMYAQEREARLLHYYDHGIQFPYDIPQRMDDTMGIGISKSGGLSLFKELAIGKNMEQQVEKLRNVGATNPENWLPRLSIDTVILGFRSSYVNSHDFFEACEMQSRISLGENLRFIPSKYAPYFGTNPQWQKREN